MLWLAFALMLVLAAVTTVGIRQRLEEVHADAAWVAHSDEVLASLARVLSSAAEAESAQRGYLLTGDERYQQDLDHDIAGLDHELDEIERLTEDNARQRERIPELRRRVADRQEQFRYSIQLRDSQGMEAARQFILTDQGRMTMIALQATVDQMVQEERALLAQRAQVAARSYRYAILFDFLAGASGLAMVVALMLLLERHQRAQERAANEQYAQQQWLRTTLSSIGDAVIATDTMGRISLLNPVAERLTGWSEAEAAGRLLEEVFHIVDEETRKPVDNPLRKVLAEGMVVGLANHAVLVARDGSQRAIDDSAAPICGAGGRVAGVVLIFRDVTERRAAEKTIAALLEREQRRSERLGQVAEAAATIAVAQTETSVLGVLKAESLRILGAEHADVLPEAAAPSSGDGRLALPLSGRAGSGGLQLVLQHAGDGAFDDDERWIAAQLARIGAISLDAARYYGELREADRRKDEFLATLSHELRNPLAPIRTSLHVMQLEGASGDQVERSRAIIDRQIQQLARLVDDLLDVSRITRGKLVLRRAPVDLAAVLQQAVETSQPLLDERGHRLELELPPQPVALYADAIRLAQVFSNLLNNAAKYTPPGGRIRIAARAGGREVEVSVRDNGVGIPPELQGHVFEMFAQAHGPSEHGQGGLGVGLGLVRQLVLLHGGSVELRSEGAGRGSEFLVRLPLARPEDLDRGSREEEAPARFRRRRILVVDDNQDAATSLDALLRTAGHEVRCAGDGLEAVAAAAEFRPEVVLLDIGLPRLDGYSAARRIRELPGGSELLLIAMTGWSQDEDRERSRAAGFDHHLAKPVDPQVLARLLAG